VVAPVPFSFGLLVPPVMLAAEMAVVLTVEFAGGFGRGGALTSVRREVRVVVVAFGPGPVLVEPLFTFTLSLFLVVVVLLEFGSESKLGLWRPGLASAPAPVAPSFSSSPELDNSLAQAPSTTDHQTVRDV
jgi:hypothetical protein